MPLKIYVDPSTLNCRKILAGLDLLGAAYESQTLSLDKSDHKSSSFLEINPNGTLPAAVIDDQVHLFESNAILTYAAEATDSPASLAAYPRDPRGKAEAINWLLWEQTSWFAPNYVYATEHVFKPIDGLEADPRALADAEGKWHARARILEGNFGAKGGSAWILGGEEPSIVDVVMGSCMMLGERQRLPLEGYPLLKRWYGELSRLPCWVRTQGPVDELLSMVPASSA